VAGSRPATAFSRRRSAWGRELGEVREPGRPRGDVGAVVAGAVAAVRRGAARASEGRAQLAALDHASELNPLSPEVAQLRTELAELGTIQVG